MMDIKEFYIWLKPGLDSIFVNDDFQKELSFNLKNFHREIKWEIGPGLRKKKFLAFSPSLNDDALKVTKELVCCAPEMDEWEFYPGKPRKRWKNRSIKISLDGDVKLFNFDRWRYYLTKFNNGEFFDVNLIPYDSGLIDDSDLKYVGDLLVEFELGELMYMDLIDRVNIIRENENESNGMELLYEQVLHEAKGYS